MIETQRPVSSARKAGTGDIEPGHQILCCSHRYSAPRFTTRITQNCPNRRGWVHARSGALGMRKHVDQKPTFGFSAWGCMLRKYAYTPSIFRNMRSLSQYFSLV